MEHAPLHVFFDVQKVIYSVLHSSLVEKTANTWFKYSYLLRWIWDYHSEREQGVVLNETISRSRHALSGVLQGSVLWLFLLTY